MNWKEILLLLLVASSVVLVGATVVEAVAESQATRSGIGGPEDPYSVSIVEPTATRGASTTIEATVVPEEPSREQNPSGRRGRKTPEPTATYDFSSTGDF